MEFNCFVSLYLPALGIAICSMQGCLEVSIFIDFYFMGSIEVVLIIKRKHKKKLCLFYFYNGWRKESTASFYFQNFKLANQVLIETEMVILVIGSAL